MDALPYVVVLAGGEGTRLQSLTRALYGQDLPKQFAVLAGGRSLLQATVERALMSTTASRISVVVGTHHEAIAREQLARYRDVELVVQPRNLDTGPGLLLPLARILAVDPAAHVVFLPSDHYIPRPRPLVDALFGVDRAAITLVGVEPTGPETEYGWIVPGEPLGHGARRVERFVEKPAAVLAERLHAQGGLWNTFILAGPGELFWDLAREHLPEHAAALEAYAISIGSSCEQLALDAAYHLMTPANFSHDVLAPASDLQVVPVAGTGWSDWGTPARVFASLRGTPDHDALVRRVREPVARPSPSPATPARFVA